jgi:hypothetical protein
MLDRYFGPTAAESAPASGSAVTEAAPAAEPIGQWTARRWCRLFHQTIEVRFGDASLEDLLLPQLVHLSCRGPRDADTTLFADRRGGDYRLFQDGRLVSSCRDAGSLQLLLHRQMGLLGCLSRDRVTVLHAGAVSDGREAIVLPGAGGSGKSTLTAALCAGGLRYLGDDMIPLQRGRCHAVPVPTCLNLKGGSLAPLRRFLPHIDAVPAIPRQGVRVHLTPPPGFARNPPERAYPVRHLVFPHYTRGAVSAPRGLSPAQALERLVAGNSLTDRPLVPEKIGELLVWLERVPAWSLEFDDLEDATAAVRELFA